MNGNLGVARKCIVERPRDDWILIDQDKLHLRPLRFAIGRGRDRPLAPE
jgi:hypothetical protein